VNAVAEVAAALAILISTAEMVALVLSSFAIQTHLPLLPQPQVHPQLQPPVVIAFINGLHPAQLLSKEKKCRTLQKLKMVSLHRLLLQNKT
jgi:hypothetical protein